MYEPVSQWESKRYKNISSSSTSDDGVLRELDEFFSVFIYTWSHWEFMREKLEEFLEFLIKLTLFRWFFHFKLDFSRKVWWWLSWLSWWRKSSWHFLKQIQLKNKVSNRSSQELTLTLCSKQLSKWTRNFERIYSIFHLANQVLAIVIAQLFCSKMLRRKRNIAENLQ